MNILNCAKRAEYRKKWNKTFFGSKQVFVRISSGRWNILLTNNAMCGIGIQTYNANAREICDDTPTRPRGISELRTDGRLFDIVSKLAKRSL